MGSVLVIPSAVVCASVYLSSVGSVLLSVLFGQESAFFHYMGESGEKFFHKSEKRGLPPPRNGGTIVHTEGATPPKQN